MLPLLLGGVALATVGYGVKKYCEEENCFGLGNDDNSNSSEQVAT